PARPAAEVPHAVLPRHPGARGGVLRPGHGRSGRGHLGGVRAVDAGRAALLLPVRLPPLAAEHRGGVPVKIETVLSGFVPEPRGRDGLTLARLLAGQSGARLQVAYVKAPAWPAPGPARAEAGAWAAFLDEQAEATLAQARELAGEDADLLTYTQ